MARVPEWASWACTVRLFSSAILRFLAEIFQAFEHCARHERQGHGRIVENLGEAPALFRRNKLSPRHRLRVGAPRDRKSTRLNSSHEWISYAVFCLKKKKK